MTPEKFTKLLDELLLPQSMNDSAIGQKHSMEDLTFLEKITGTFPACQTAQVLYAIQLQRQKNILYPIQLKKAAVYAPDRKLLYRYIMQPFPPLEHSDAGTSATTVETPVLIKSEPVKRLDTPTAEQISQDGVKKITGLEEEILKEAVNAAMTKEVMEEMTAGANRMKNEEMIEKEEEELQRMVHTGKETGVPQEMIQDEIKVSSAGKKKKSIEINREKERMSFSNWLKNISPSPQYGRKQEKRSSQKATEKQSPGTTEELLNKFIRDNPQIKPVKDFYSPSNFAKISAQDDESLVTETLAKIYLQQGDFSKAVRIYTLLAEQEPSKKEYFEEQIKKINLNPS